MIELNAEDRTFAVSRGTYSIASLRATGVKRLDMSRGAAFAAAGGHVMGQMGLMGPMASASIP